MKKPNVLIIEDDLEMLDILTYQIEKIGCVVSSAIDGAAGLNLVEQNKPDLILLDTMLPGMNGIEVCIQLRRRYSPTELPIIILSALGEDPSERVLGLQAGANDYLGKPHHPSELQLKIKTMLKIRQETAQKESLLLRYVQPVLRQPGNIDPETPQQGMGVVLMADLRGFTALTTQVETMQVMQLLDEYFTAMVQIVNDHGGVVLDIVGDALLAVYNLPNPLPVPCQLSLQTALEMQKTFQLLQQQWRKFGMEVGMGIGIYAGEVILGNIGTEGLMRYTVVGTAVNLASRLVKLAADGEVVVSAQIYEHTQIPPELPVKTLPEMQLKGARETQTLYQIQAVENRIME